MKWSDIFPQPVGIFPYPLSFLIVPYVQNWQKHIKKLINLEFKDLPEEWKFVKYLNESEIDKALKSLDNIQEEPVKQYISSILKNIYIKNPDTQLDNLLKMFFGEILEFDTDRYDLKALQHFIKADYLIKENDTYSAVQELDNALKLIKNTSPIFQAQILLKKVKLIIQQKGVNFSTIALLEQIYNSLKNSNAKVLKAEASFNLGNAYSSLGNIQNAIKHYTEALEVYKKDKYPYMYALINNNMGLAYLSIQATDLEDHMRLAYGIQCLKNALKIFTKDKYPDEWASTSLNYANGLQYLPTANPIKNLLEAVNIYKEILNYRKQQNDEIGYARTLANLGNALAHLGKLDDAKNCLLEAKMLFSKYGMKEEKQAIDEILEEIHLVEVKGNE